ncbi:MAG: CotH kinase family protein, partial [Dehalococcoidia bacterium]
MPHYWERTLERKLDRRGFLALIGGAGAATALIACSGDNQPSKADGNSAPDNATGGRPSGWVEATHGNVDPDFATVFPSNAVNQIKLTIGKDDWQAMLDDMTTLFGNRGTGGGFGPGGGQMQQPPGGNQPPGQVQQPPGNAQQGGPGGGPAATTTKKPMWVAGDLSFNGQTWTKVGMRFKGNSSLRQSWGTTSDRMPFKLDFDQWEGDFPEIENQRFYGFKQLSLSNNVGDASGMRETLAYDAFEAAGLPAANTAFYEVILDRGDGETSLGIYTVIEVVDDTVIDRVFGGDKGNIYEAEGSAAALTPGTAAAVKTSFQKENNEDAADWSDVERFVSILNADKRVSDLAGWRKDL